jgi:glycosyltransferase involved in cell wall biosynthesis
VPVQLATVKREKYTPEGVSQPVVDVVIAAHNCAETLPQVLADIPPRQRRSVVVVDYGSTDATGQAARDAGAVVLRESRGGYGAACRRAVDHLAALPTPSDVVVFLAADGSDDPREIQALVRPIARGEAELVIGKRSGRGGGVRTAVAVKLIGAIYRHQFEDLGPFRAIRLPALVALGMRDSGTGYHAEMQVKAVRLGLNILEVPVASRRVESGLGSTTKVLFHIFRNATAR